MSLLKSYSMMQNARVTALTLSELLRENEQGVGTKCKAIGCLET